MLISERCMQKKSTKLLKPIHQKNKRILVKWLRFLWGSVRFRPHFEGSLKRVVILAQEKLGDAILLTPLFKLLRKNIPGVHITIVALGSEYDFYERDPNIDHVYRVKESWPRYLKSVLRERYDLLYCPKDHPSFSFLFQSFVFSSN